MSKQKIFRHYNGRHLLEVDEAGIQALRILKKYYKKTMKVLIKEMAMEKLSEVPAGKEIKQLILMTMKKENK